MLFRSSPEDEHGSSDGDREPGGKFAEPGVGAGGAEKFRGIERRKVGAEVIVVALKRGPSGVDDVDSEAEEGEQRLNPPRIAAGGLTKASAIEWDIDRRHGIVRLAD